MGGSEETAPEVWSICTAVTFASEIPTQFSTSPTKPHDPCPPQCRSPRAHRAGLRGCESVPARQEASMVLSLLRGLGPAEIWGCNATGVYSGLVADGNGNSADVSNRNRTFPGLAFADVRAYPLARKPVWSCLSFGAWAQETHFFRYRISTPRSGDATPQACIRAW
jgi:hypothetical protein